MKLDYFELLILYKSDSRIYARESRMKLLKFNAFSDQIIVAYKYGIVVNQAFNSIIRGSFPYSVWIKILN